MARSFTFETLSRREVARLRRDAQEPYTLLGYEDTESRPLGLVGDDVGPYVHMIGRAALDGGDAAPADIPVVAQGEAQRVLVDEYGRIWANVNISPAEVQNIQGNIANDAADADSYPVKIGGRAVLTPSVGLAVAVAVDDRVDAAFDLNGRQIVVAGGDVASDAVDAGNPVKIGAFAVAIGSAPAAVTAGDRVNLAASRQGALHTLTTPNPLADATTYVYTVAALAAGDASGRVAFKASPGRLRRVCVVNNSATVAMFLQIHNTTAVGTVATGTMLWAGVPVPANGGIAEIDFSEADLACSSGICAALSTTQNTYTASASTGFFSAQYA